MSGLYQATDSRVWLRWLWHGGFFSPDPLTVLSDRQLFKPYGINSSLVMNGTFHKRPPWDLTAKRSTRQQGEMERDSIVEWHWISLQHFLFRASCACRLCDLKDFDWDKTGTHFAVEREPLSIRFIRGKENHEIHASTKRIQVSPSLFQDDL